MAAFLVHGVPDTAALWDRERGCLQRDDVVALSMPGFGTPLPDGFEPTKESYAGWLVDRIEELGEPVDLVGHDWGSLLAQRVASLRPDLIRTLAFGSGPIDVDYTWHDMAQLWQTPEVGEQIAAAMTPEAMRVVLAAEIDEAAAEQASLHLDDTMKRCILALYRSAVNVGSEWQAGVEAVAGRFPSLVLWGSNDPYVAAEFGERAAERLHGRLVLFDDSGHWWPLTKPAETATELEALWRSAKP
jgi:pimeloyl-ACP methyl ester carboxylesterase